MYHQSPLAPPPLPPSAPPAPCMPPINSNLVSKGKSSAPDRNALLAQIRGGKTLKKTVTNDRSAPQVNNSKTFNGTGNINNKSSVIQNDPLGLGTIFAQGKPKLRPSFKPEKSNTETITAKQNDKSQLSNISRNAFNPPSYNKEIGKSNIPQININDSCQTSNIGNFKLNSPMKAMKPTPPPASSKPSFNPIPPPASSKPTFNPIPPPASSKPNFNINLKSEISQGNKTIGRSFNSKPMPPPKILENSSLKFATMHQQLNKTDKTHLGVASPKLPVRNNSSPDNLNELAKSNALKVNMINPPSVKRSTSTGSRQQMQIKAPNYRPPPPPPIKSNPPAIPSVPPPIPKRSIPIITNSNLNITNNMPPPPPPLRTTSRNYLMGHDFEARFSNNFHKIQEFPVPHYEQTSCKMYISQVETADLKHQRNIKSEKEMIRSVEC